ncbi:MAG: TrpR-like protein, YerC/YecD [Clostridia bacterium]|nr:TrpR-like protein, YerC/YecD [Clostridia bacterium]
MDDRFKNGNLDFLFDCILKLESKQECYNFFEDLCTMPELQAISQRIVVAKMLTGGKVYKEIETETGASTATISRVKRSLQYGAEGYDVIFERLGIKGKNE